MKKVVSCLLAVSMLFTVSSTAFASEIKQTTKEEALITDVAKIKNEMPDAEVRVVDGVIHVVVDDLSEVEDAGLSRQVAEAKTTSVVSSEGGTYRDFVVPSWAYYSFAPSSQVYMNKNRVELLKGELTKPGFIKWVAEQVTAGVATSTIVALAASVWGISIPAGAVGLAVSFVMWSGSNLDYYSIVSAQNQSTTGKVSVVRGTGADGSPVNIYSPWNNNICTTYGEFEAVWYEGRFDPW